MAKDDKLIGAMRANPHGWRIADIERACRLAGLSCTPPTGGGSHYKIGTPRITQILTMPFKRPIKSVYVRALIRLIEKPVAMIDQIRRYSVNIGPLSPEDGGGFIARVPDLPGCMSDGETPEEALENVYDAIACWIEAANELGHTVPPPSKLAA